MKMGLNTIFAILGLPFRFKPPRPSGEPEAERMWFWIRQSLGRYRPKAEFVTDLITSEEADGRTILMLQSRKATELTVICGRDWRFAVKAVQSFLYHRYWPNGPKPRVIGLPYRSTMTERVVLGWIRGVLYRIIPWSCLGQMRRPVLDELDALRR